jgi:hypothetical protein
MGENLQRRNLKVKRDGPQATPTAGNTISIAWTGINWQLRGRFVLIRSGSSTELDNVQRPIYPSAGEIAIHYAF